jgi:large subunit ribosomal protein L30
VPRVNAASRLPRQARRKGIEMANTLRITWVRSSIGYAKDQKATVKALGLHRLHETIEQPDTRDIRGMIHKVQHMLQVEEIS